jgi:hypothetical protein
MDIVAHGLWAAAGVVVLRRTRPLPRSTALALVGLAVAPDLVQLLPLVGAALSGSAGWGVLWAYGKAAPGTDPVLSPLLALWTHHLHCTLHSAVVAAAVTALAWALTRRFWLPLAGWWSHIAIDVFTHSADFYPVPVLYPFTQRGFDGVAWNTPAFMTANYAALAAVAAWLILTRRGRSPPR